MHIALAFVILIGTASNIFTSAVNYDMINSILDDIRNYNTSCPTYDSCKDRTESDSLRNYDCQCSSICLLYGTCCINSEFIHLDPPKTRPSCRSIDNIFFNYMVDRCPESVNKDSIWHSLCQDDWKGGDEEVDIMKIVPVTSMFSRLTYKNYFCFRCNEGGDDFQYWPVELGSSDYEFDESIDQSSVSLSYDTTYRTWVAPLGIGGTLIPVNMTIQRPIRFYSMLDACKPEVISRCADTWNDTDVSDKCQAYMSITYLVRGTFDTVTYKNIHCALCNYEDLSIQSCRIIYAFSFGGKVPFSFTHLLDVNRSDGDEVGKIRKCENNFLWDPYAKKCRKLTCALPGYVVKNGKCSPP